MPPTPMNPPDPFGESQAKHVSLDQGLGPSHDQIQDAILLLGPAISRDDSMSLRRFFVSLACYSSWMGMGMGMGLGLGLGITTGCKTAATQPSNPVLSSAPTIRGQGWSATLELDETTSQDLYLKVLKGELDAGAQAPKDESHKSRAALMCQRNVDKTRCVVAPILKGWILGPDQPLSEGVSRELSQFVASARPELAAIPSSLGLVSCHYLGKSSPPFGIEKAKCALSFPHTPDEIVFLDQPAEVLAEGLRNEQSHGQGETVLRGTLFCQLTDEDRLSPCMTRGHHLDGVKDRVAPLAADEGPLVLQILRFGLFQLRPRATSGAAASAAGEKKSDVHARLDIKLELECQLDSSQVPQDGKRMVRCLGKI